MIVIFDSRSRTDLSSLNAVADCTTLVTRVMITGELPVNNFHKAVSVVTQASVSISKAEAEGVEVLIMERTPIADLVNLNWASPMKEEAELVGEVAIHMAHSWALMGHDLYSLNQTPQRVVPYPDGSSSVISLTLEQVPSSCLSRVKFITEEKADQHG